MQLGLLQNADGLLQANSVAAVHLYTETAERVLASGWHTGVPTVPFSRIIA
jgi:hypothetical protein